MFVRKIFSFFLFFAFDSLPACSIENQFQEKGYVEIYNQKHSAATYEALYAYFDELIEFLQTHPLWANKLYIAKERFLRSRDRNSYSTDVFGFYDESARRSLISFYYSTHFHEFITSHYPEFKQAFPIIRFFEACLEIQTPYGTLFEETAASLGLETIFSPCEHPPILFKVVKYFPSYMATKPHYDGTAFSLFLDSTDNQSLLLSPYKSFFTVDDFFSAPHTQNSILLLPGTLLGEFSIYPTPHIPMQNGKIRYATIAFAMRPHHLPQTVEYSSLPSF